MGNACEHYDGPEGGLGCIGCSQESVCIPIFKRRQQGGAYEPGNACSHHDGPEGGPGCVGCSQVGRCPPTFKRRQQGEPEDPTVPEALDVRVETARTAVIGCSNTTVVAVDRRALLAHGVLSACVGVQWTPREVAEAVAELEKALDALPSPFQDREP